MKSPITKKTCVSPSFPLAPLLKLRYITLILRNNMDKLVKTLQEKEAKADVLRRALVTVEVEINLLKDLLGKPVSDDIELRGAPGQSRVKTIAQKLQGRPNISLRDAANKGICELGEFTKQDLQNWIDRTYPGLGTSIKSLDRIIYQAIKEGHVTLFKKNFGAKSPAVYKWMKGEG